MIQAMIRARGPCSAINGPCLSKRVPSLTAAAPTPTAAALTLMTDQLFLHLPFLRAQPCPHHFPPNPYCTARWKDVANYTCSCLQCTAISAQNTRQRWQTTDHARNSVFLQNDFAFSTTARWEDVRNPISLNHLWCAIFESAMRTWSKRTGRVREFLVATVHA
jgi:hypothetical protein